MKVEQYDGSTTNIFSIEFVGTTPTTYNLTVADYHSYFAGEQEALVHNCGCTSMGSKTFYASNGVGAVMTDNIKLSNGVMTFENFTVGTQKELFGIGKSNGILELMAPLKEMVKFAQDSGAKTITITGKYMSESGAALGGGKVHDSFEKSFDASSAGLKQFFKDVRGTQSDNK